jgi:hypothetical protein
MLRTIRMAPYSGVPQRIWERPGRRRVVWTEDSRGYVVTLFLPGYDGLEPVMEVDGIDCALKAKRLAKRWAYNHIKF